MAARFAILVPLLAAASALWLSQSAPLGAQPVVRVCADPDNMPFSNSKGEGFENKLSELIADRLGETLEYRWFEENVGYLPNTVGEGACDLVMGYAQGTGLIDDTNPYYHTSYVLITRKDDPDLKDVETLSDPSLRGKRIGLFARTPPASILAMHGLVANARPFEVRAEESQSEAANAMIVQIAAGTLDAGLLWGPVGGTMRRAPRCRSGSCPSSRRPRDPKQSTRSPLASGPESPPGNTASTRC